jgi:catalase
VHRGVAPYRPNSLDGGCPFVAGSDTGAYIEAPVPVAASPKVRDAAASFDDHFSQPRLFWRSMSEPEREHIAAAYAFELGKCYEKAVKERGLKVLANIDAGLCRTVAEALGLPAPGPTVALADPEPSPALSQIGRTWPLDGRVVGIVVPDAGHDVAEAGRLVRERGMLPLVVAPTGGEGVQRSYATARSIEFDALLVAGAPASGTDGLDQRLLVLVGEAYRHGKPLGAFGGGEAVLAAAGVSTGGEAVLPASSANAPTAGVVTADNATTAVELVADLLGGHRVWDRFPVTPGL